MRIFTLTLTAGSLLACGSDDTTPPQDSRPQTLTWASCAPLVTSSALSKSDLAPECTTTEVALDHARPEGPKITIAARRYLAGVAPSDRQVWYLDGGPGGTGASIEADSTLPFFHDQGWDVYVSVHRGSGASTALNCPEQSTQQSPKGERLDESEIAACGAAVEAEWGSGLRFFDADHQAHDLARFVELSRGDSEIFVWGTSYGTYRAFAFVELYPEVPDAVIVDAVLDLESDPWNDSVYANTAAVRTFVDACLADASCMTNTATRPEDVLRASLSVADAKTCAPLVSAGIDRRALQLAYTQMGEIQPAHSLIFPTAVRIAECDPSTEAVAALIQTLAEIDPIDQAAEQSASGSSRAFFNELLYANVSCRDLHRPELTDDEIDARDRSLVFIRDEPANLNQICAQWPVAASAERRPAYPYTGPMLILQGGLDFPTPLVWAERASTRYSGATLLRLPAAGHALLDRSGFSAPPAAAACAFDVLTNFLADPSMLPEPGRCEDVSPMPDLSGQHPFAQMVATQMFGEANVWAGL